MWFSYVHLLGSQSIIMGMSTYLNVVSFFQFLCIISAITLGILCILEFVKDEDLTEVSFKRFNEDEESIYPEITICMSDAYLGNKLNMFGEDITETAYERFLKGQLWDDRMLDIDYNNVTLDIEDYLIETCIKQKFTGDCTVFNATVSVFVNQLRKCFTIHNPLKTNMLFVEAKLRAALFPKFIRPLDFRFVVRFSFPKQIFRSAVAVFGNWPDRTNATKSFVMDFRMYTMQVVSHRNKSSKPCYDWRNYDELVFEEMVNEVGCRPVYWYKGNSLPKCKTKDEMKYFADTFYERYFPIDQNTRNIPPCLEVQYVQIDHKDLGRDNIDEQDAITQGNLTDSDAWFKIRFWYRSTSFMQIKQVQAYSIESLIGNGGGYVGLFLGYSLIQLPYLLAFILSSVRKMVTEKYGSSSNPRDNGKMPDITPIIGYYVVPNTPRNSMHNVDKSERISLSIGSKTKKVDANNDIDYCLNV